MQNIKESPQTRADHLDFVRGVAIVMVVGIHTFAYLPSAATSETISFVVNHILLSMAVPIFFLVDGYLLNSSFKKKSQMSYSSYCHKSFYRLIVPWIIFSTAYLAFRFVAEYSGRLEPHLVLDLSFYKVVSSIYYSMYSAQLYFLVSLFIIRVCLFHSLRWLQEKTYLILIAAIAIHILNRYTNLLSSTNTNSGELDPFIHAAWGAQFFLIGFALRNINYKGQLQMPTFILILICSALAVASIETQFMQSICLSVIFLVLADVFNLKWNCITTLGKQTMGIYILHAPVLVFVLAKVFEATKLNAELKFILATTSISLTSFLAAYLISKFRLGRISFGQAN